MVPVITRCGNSPGYDESGLPNRQNLQSSADHSSPDQNRETGEWEKSIHPMATVFEQSLLLVFDLIVLELMKKMAKTSETMLRRHANLE